MNEVIVRKAAKSDALNISVLAGCVWVNTYTYTGIFDSISKYVSEQLCEEKISNIIDENIVFVCVNKIFF